MRRWIWAKRALKKALRNTDALDLDEGPHHERPHLFGMIRHVARIEPQR